MVFSKGDSTEWFFKLYAVTQMIQDTLYSYKINYLTEKCNQNLLGYTNLTPDENNQVMKKLNLFQSDKPF